jgi:hypothetical protein
MTFPRARLTVAAVLFLAWLGYLLLLVILSRNTVVLSRPQLLAASVWAVAEVVDDGTGKPAPEAVITDVPFCLNPAARNLVGQKVKVANLPEAGPHGYKGPGVYLLPLDNVVQVAQGGKLHVVDIKPVPRTPGYVPTHVNVRLLAVNPKEEGRVGRLAETYLGVAADEARKPMVPLLNREVPSVTLARNVPREKALEFLNHLHIGEDGRRRDDIATVMLAGNDVRIYPWTVATKEQVDELLQ